MNAGLWGRGAGRHSDFSMVSICLPFWKPVRLNWNWGIIHKCSRTYRNNNILSFDYYLSVRAVYYGTPFDFYPFNTNDHRYPYLNSIYKWKYLDSLLMQISLFQICIRDTSFSYKIEFSTFKIKIFVFQMQISVFKNKNWCLYLKYRYVYLKYRYLYFKCRNL